jgi:uracil-DNA glycosylase
MTPTRNVAAELKRLQDENRRCTICADQRLIPEANPTFEGSAEACLMLIGQAPGPVERESRRPFSGRAGRELSRWMLRAGFESEEDFRSTAYIASMARCFPGRNPTGAGDLRPPARSVANCSSWLEAELALLQPAAIIAVGQMAITRFLGPGSLEERVGRSFLERPRVIPLPHPSGQSRWLNEPANRDRLAAALEIISAVRQECRKKSS